MPTPVVPAVYGVFDCTLDAVYRLCPEAERITDPNASTMPTPITEDTVATWIVEVSAAVAAGIGPWMEITGGSLDRIKAAARVPVANGVASYLESARYPTQLQPIGSTYAGFLWTRYLQGLTQIQSLVTLMVREGSGDVHVTGMVGGPFASFPYPYFYDEVLW